MVVCLWCGEEALWSTFLDTHWCADCRTDEVGSLDRLRELAKLRVKDLSHELTFTEEDSK